MNCYYWYVCDMFSYYYEIVFPFMAIIFSFVFIKNPFISEMENKKKKKKK